MGSPFSSDKFAAFNICKLLLVSVVAIYLIFTISLPKQLTYPNFSPSEIFSLFINHQTPSISQSNSPTHLSHIAFAIMGSEGGYHFRQHYIESWWRPNATRGFLYLEKPPSTDLLPWSVASPPYKVSDNLTKLLEKTGAAVPGVIRIVHGIKEVLRDADDGDVRWVVIGDDDSIFFVDNVVDVLAQYDHTKHYYIGAPSEFIMSNVWFSRDCVGIGGAGIVLSYALAKIIADDMDDCIRRYAPFLITADIIIMACVNDVGVDLSQHRGLHQIDFRGDISGFLSWHPISPLMSLHHLDMVDPIFPNMDRKEALRHLMKAAAADESRTLQQTVCHERERQWTISVSWGYSAQIYERIMPRSHLLRPMETFKVWMNSAKPPPYYMFNTRLPTGDPCEAPHFFFMKEVNKSSTGILTTYSRAWPRNMNPCLWCGSQCPDFVTQLRVFSPITNRKGKDIDVSAAILLASTVPLWWLNLENAGVMRS